MIASRYLLTLSLPVALILPCAGCEKILAELDDESSETAWEIPATPEPTAEPGQTLKETVLAMRENIETDVAAGFVPTDQIARSNAEAYADRLDLDTLQPIAERIASRAIKRHLESQEKWPAVTDCDRLNEAFAELETRGIVARQNFSCCGTCGVGEIDEQLQVLQTDDRPARGYTFYNVQDTASAVNGEHLYLNYGSSDFDEAEGVQIAQEIVRTLNRRGLKTEWDGKFESRIQVNLTWQRRR